MDTTLSPSVDGKSNKTHMDQSAWMLMLRGVLAIAFGVLAVLLPELTLLVLVALFAAYALLGGLVSVAAAVRMRQTERQWWLLLLLGIVSLAAGIYALLAPGVTALALVLVMGVNAILTGALDIAIAVRLRRVLRGHWLLVLGGVVSVLFGLLVVAAPAAGALAMVWLISAYAVVSGVLMFSLGLRTRRAAAFAQPLAAGRP